MATPLFSFSVRSPSLSQPSSSTPPHGDLVSPISASESNDSASAITRPSSGIIHPDDEIPLSIEQINAALIANEIDITQLDLLFVRSRLLSSSGIVSFVKGLCEVSK